MALRPGMTIEEDAVCTAYLDQIHGSHDWDHDQAALDRARAELGPNANPEALRFVERSQQHIDALRKVTTR